MIKDLFINNKIKKQYISKPVSIFKFVKLIEKRNDIKIYKEIKKILKHIYPNSYDTKFKVLNVTGPRASGKTFLSYVIILYDAYRTTKLINFNKDEFVVCSLSTKLQAEALKQSLLKIKSVPYLPKIIIKNFNEITGINPDVFITDEPSVSKVIRSNEYDLAYNKFLLNKNNSHFITIADIRYNKNSYDINDDTLLVNLSGDNK